MAGPNLPGSSRHIPEDFRGAVLRVLDDVMIRLFPHSGIVMAKTEIGPFAGEIKIFCQELFPQALPADVTNWLKCYPSQSPYSHVIPDIGDHVLFRWKSLVDDGLEYLGLDRAWHSPVKTGAGLKTIFAYSATGLPAAGFCIYLDTLQNRFVIEVNGVEVAVFDAEGIKTDLDVQALAASPLTAVGLATHTHPYIDTPVGPSTTSAPTPGS